jgi:uncharacterized protein YerC
MRTAVISCRPQRNHTYTRDCKRLHPDHISELMLLSRRIECLALGNSETTYRSCANVSLSKRLQYIRIIADKLPEKTMQEKHAELMNLDAVAKEAGVSTATVSRVLNDLNVVKNSTRARVLKAVEELKYHPNLHARSLARGKSRTLGILVSNMENPFFSISFGLLNQRRTPAVMKWLSRTRTTAPSNSYPARA